MMRHKSLRRSIVGAYLLFAMAICGFFGIVATVAIEGMEDLLVDEHLRSIASWASPRHASGLPVDMPSDISFYHSSAIPLELDKLPHGVGKQNFEGKPVHFLVSEDAVGKFVVVDRASEYKSIERSIYGMVLAGFFAFVAFSLFLGRFIAHRVVEPISKLADAVRDANPELPLLSSEGELGVLARSFDAHTSELRRFLTRERFFTGDVSHELRTPLTVISGAAELLIEQTTGQPALHKPAERILRAAREATDCVTVLLLLARGPHHIERPETSISKVVREEVARSQALLKDKPVALHFEESNDFHVAAPRELLTAAIGNLIRNACLYTDQGKVTIRLSGHAVIVEDTGPGLPQSVHARLKNEELSTPLVGSAGTGLGLALVVRICEYLGATLNAENNPKIGSNLRIDFLTTLTKT